MTNEFEQCRIPPHQTKARTVTLKCQLANADTSASQYFESRDKAKRVGV